MTDLGAERFDRTTFSAFRLLPPHLDPTTGVVRLRSALDGVEFIETVRIPLPAGGAAPADPSAVQRVLALLNVVAGVSYVKAAPPGRVVVEHAGLTAAGLAFARLAYDKGLREYAVRNGFAVPFEIAWEPVALSPAVTADRPEGGRPVVPIGGGKDSCVVTEALRHDEPILVSVKRNPYAEKVAQAVAAELVTVERAIAPSLLELNRRGALNGHVPVTAIVTLIGTLTSLLHGAGDVVMANERSSSAPTTVVGGHEVNHQWSKSFEAEGALSAALAEAGAPSAFSLVRPYGELALARAFASLPHLHRAFMSCNRAFVFDPAERSGGWCGACPKCRFVFLALAPFIGRSDLVAVFGGRDLLDEPQQTDGFRALFDTGSRPYECVGEWEESATAMALLADRADWREAAVVRALHDSAARHARPLEELLRADPQHSVPPRWLARIEAVMG